jgi:protein O-GlcNAc transferase|tara:strand:- start:217 stop:1905 length:1689 start_codon:yes stop_codon:yes gene_type:complete
MISENIKQKIKNLFDQKKYSEVIYIAEKYTNLKERPPGLINIIGISKFYKDNLTRQDMFEALSCFEQTFIKGQNSVHGLNGLMNLIKLGLKASFVFKDLSKFLHNAAIHYSSAEKYFDKNDQFLDVGLDLFSHLLNIKKQKEIIHKILNSNTNSKFLRGRSLFFHNYFYDWSQKHHLSNAKKNLKYFSKLKVIDIKKIDYENKDKINLGFVSCDFSNNHSTTFFIKDVIKYLDRKKFKISIFSITKKNINDQSQNELRESSDNWFDLKESNNQNVVEIIQKKKIDILVDLIGYTKPERLEIFFSRVAPIQISWLAYCNTTGFDTIDYLIADNNLILPNEEDLYSEKIIKMPHIWNAHSGFKISRKFNELPCLNKNKFTFGSFNNFRKISDETIKAWSAILKKVSNSRLILKSSTPCDEESLINKFRLNGVSNRVEIFNKSDFFKKDDHLKLYNKIDLCLDTFPYNGVTTTFEALWMNVPVLALKGYNFNSRCGESILQNSKFNFLISRDVNDYISKAVFLSQDENKLSKIRKEIYDEIMETALFDTKKFSKNFNDLLLKIYD